MRFQVIIGGVLFLSTLVAPTGAAKALIVTLEVPAVLSVSDEGGSFALNFSNFLKGTVSASHSVTYRIQANNLARGIVQGAVSARLEEVAEGVELEADVNAYQNLGEGHCAVLEEAQSGYQPIRVAQTTPLAHKIPGTGGGDATLDGNLTVTWRARLTADAPAGQQSRFLVVTVREGS